MMALPKTSRLCRGFTLVELLVAISILAALIVLLAGIFRSTSAVWSQSSRRIDAFRDARAALRLMTDDLRGTLPSRGIPSLVLEKLSKESDQAGMEGNDQVFALITRSNDGRSDVCAIGYYCTWNEKVRAYEMRRSFADSDTTYARIVAAGESKAGHSPLAVFQPSDSDEVLVRYAWNLKIVPIDADGSAITPVPTVFGQSELPAALEISFDAISPEAVRALGSQDIVSDFWFHPQSHVYKNQIAPAMQRFRTRIDITMGGTGPDA